MAFGSYATYKLLFEDENPIGPALVVGAIVLGIGFAVIKRVGTKSREGRKPQSTNATSARVDRLRQEGKIKGPFTYADAVELTTTGTITPKSLAQKIHDSSAALGWLFESEDHGGLYQYEMGGVTARNVDEAIEASQALGRPSIVLLLQATKSAFDEFDRVNAEARAAKTATSGDWYAELGYRTMDIGALYREHGGSDLSKTAAERYLSKHAPQLLPLPSH